MVKVFSDLPLSGSTKANGSVHFTHGSQNEVCAPQRNIIGYDQRLERCISTILISQLLWDRGGDTSVYISMGWRTLLFGLAFVTRVCAKLSYCPSNIRVCEYSLLSSQTKLLISWCGGSRTKSQDHFTPLQNEARLERRVCLLVRRQSHFNYAIKLSVAHVRAAGICDSSRENQECCTSNCSSSGEKLCWWSQRVYQYSDKDMRILVQGVFLMERVQPNMHFQQD